MVRLAPKDPSTTAVSIGGQNFFIDPDGGVEIPDALSPLAFSHLEMRKWKEEDAPPIDKMTREQMIGVLIVHARAEMEKADEQQLRDAVARIRTATVDDPEEAKPDGDQFDKMKRHEIYAWLREKGVKLGAPPHTNDDLREIARTAAAQPTPAA